MPIARSAVMDAAATTATKTTVVTSARVGLIVEDAGKIVQNNVVAGRYSFERAAMMEQSRYIIF